MTGDPLIDAWRKPEPPPPGPRPVSPISGDRMGRWAGRAVDNECAAVEGAAEGTRNDTLNRASFALGTIVGGGYLDYGVATSRLDYSGRKSGLLPTEVAKTVASGLKAGMEHPRQLPDAADGGTAGVSAGGAPPITVVGPVPGWSPPGHDNGDGVGPDDDEKEHIAESEFWHSRPYLVQIFGFARARRVSPWAVLGVVLARVVAATPHWLVLPPIVGGEASLNTFVGLVGRSGMGKGAATGVAARAFDVRTGHEFKTIKTGSGEGIAHGYMRNVKGVVEQHTQAVLFDVPEIDTLTALGSRQGATLLPELRSGWSGELMGFAYADPMKRLPVPAHRYRMCMVAGIQPSRAGALLNDADAGTPQRYVWLPASDPRAPDRAPEEPRTMMWVPPHWGRLTTLTTEAEAPNGDKLVVMPVCDLAWQVIDAASLGRLRSTDDALDGHALLCRLKVAAALALMEGRVNVSEADWELSGPIMAKSDATRASVAAALSEAAARSNRSRALSEADRVLIVNEKVADVAVRRVCRQLVLHLRREADWLPWGKLRKRLPSRDRQHAEAAIEHLLDAGQIEQQETPHGLVFRLPEGLL